MESQLLQSIFKAQGTWYHIVSQEIQRNIQSGNAFQSVETPCQIKGRLEMDLFAS